MYFKYQNNIKTRFLLQIIKNYYMIYLAYYLEMYFFPSILKA